MIAALCVDPHGIYAGLADVEIWDEARDARNYPGPHVVIAHPPCARWCRIAGLVEARCGYKRGDDGGVFAACLRAVRSYGGILEHPAYSGAWLAFDLPSPHRNGGWFGSSRIGYVTHVEQGRYGHLVKKATWLYTYGVPLDALPRLRWGAEADQKSTAPIAWRANKADDSRPRLGKKAANATPIEFRNELLAIARAIR